MDKLQFIIPASYAPQDPAAEAAASEDYISFANGIDTVLSRVCIGCRGATAMIRLEPDCDDRQALLDVVVILEDVENRIWGVINALADTHSRYVARSNV